HVVQHEGRAQVFLQIAHLDVVDLDPFDVADEEPVSGSDSEITRLGIPVVPLFLRRFERRLLLRAAALVIDADVAERHVFNRIAGVAADDAAVFGGGVIDDHVADFDAPQFAGRRAFGRAHPAAQPEEDRGVGDVAHRDVGDRHVFEQPAVNRFKRQPARVIEDAVGDRDVFEAAVGFGAELDPARRAVVAVFLIFALAGAVEERALVVAADLAVGDRHVLGRAGEAEAVGTLQADAVIEGRVDAAIRDAHVAARVNVHPVAVRVELHVINRQVINAGREDGEPAAVQDRDVADHDIAAELEADRLVTAARGPAVIADETFAPDQAGPEDRNVFEALAPDQAVVPVAVTEVLKFAARRVRLGRVIGHAFGRGGGENRRALINVERDVALQANRDGEVSAG